MLENRVKARIVEEMMRSNGYARRIEDQYLVGTPDLILSLPSTGLVMTEAKVFTGNVFEPSPRQYIEMKRIEAGGGKTLLVGWKAGIFHLHGLDHTDKVVRGRVQADACVKDSDFVEAFKHWFEREQNERQ